MIRTMFCALALMGISTVALGGELNEPGLRAFGSGDHALAAGIWQQRADHGDATAQYRLAYLYQTGMGVTADQAAALKWYRAAAAQGHATAYYQLKRLEGTVME